MQQPTTEKRFHTMICVYSVEYIVEVFFYLLLFKKAPNYIVFLFLLFVNYSIVLYNYLLIKRLEYRIIFNED